jgi:hypothetical protein
MTDGTTPPPSRFVRGHEHLDRLLSDPQLAADVAQAGAKADDITPARKDCGP